jgi:hypothetical protein
MRRNRLASRLLNDNSENPSINFGGLNIPVRTRGLTMDFGLMVIIATSLLATVIYVILNWLWQS